MATDCSDKRAPAYRKWLLLWRAIKAPPCDFPVLGRWKYFTLQICFTSTIISFTAIRNWKQTRQTCLQASIKLHKIFQNKGCLWGKFTYHLTFFFYRNETFILMENPKENSESWLPSFEYLLSIVDQSEALYILGIHCICKAEIFETAKIQIRKSLH